MPEPTTGADQVTTPPAGPPAQIPNPRQAAFDLLATKALADYASAQMGVLRKQSAAAFLPGDRTTALSPADDLPLGMVIATKPEPEAVIVDQESFDDWMIEHHSDRCGEVPVLLGTKEQVAEVLRQHAPDLVTFDVRPRPWAEAELLRNSLAAGEPVGPAGETGELAPPGVVIRRGESVLQVKLEKGAIPRVRELWRNRMIDPMPELPPAS